MSDFTKAMARISEGFCPIHGIALRRVSSEWLDRFLQRKVVPLRPTADEAALCGMCDGGRLWWVHRIDVTTHDSGPEALPMLCSIPELTADERRFLYDRGEA